MARARRSQFSFSGGEISPRLYGRTDFAKYGSSCALLQNMIAQQPGGTTRRPGTKYITTTKNAPSTDSVKVVSFLPSSGDPFVLEFGQTYIRFMQNGTPVVSGTAVSACTRGKGSTANVTAGSQSGRTITLTIGAHSLKAGDFIHVAGSGAFPTFWRGDFVLTAVTATTVSYVIGGTQTGTFGGSATVAIWQDAFTVGSAAGMTVGDSATTSNVTSSPTSLLNETGRILSIVGAVVTLPASSAASATYLSGGVLIDTTLGTSPYTLTSPYTVAGDVTLLQFAQVNDIMYCFHPNYPPYKLSHLGQASWTIVNTMDTTTLPGTFLLNDGPYLTENITGTTLTPTANALGSTTLTASAVTGINNNTGFQSTDVGRIVRWNTNLTTKLWGWGVITAITSTTVVTFYIMRIATSAAAASRWNLGAWSVTTGYPTACTFFQQRLYGANTSAQSQTIWGSVSGGLENFQPTGVRIVYIPGTTTLTALGDDTVTDDCAVVITPAFTRTAIIRWLQAQRSMMVGTGSVVYELRGTSQTNAVTPLSSTVNEASAFPAQYNVQPVRIGEVLLMAQEPGRKLRELVYSLATDTYSAEDLSIVADHLTAGGIRQMVYADNPDSLLWVLKNDGTLSCLTFNRQQQISGWHSHILGGNYGGSAPYIESMAVVPGTSYSQVYLVVWRTVNGSTTRSIEYFQTDFNSILQTQSQAWHLDMATQQVNGVASATVTGLTYLNGETVQVYADGANVADQVVSGGGFTLPNAATTVLVGYGYTSQFTSLPMHQQAQADNLFLGMKVRVRELFLTILDTAGLFFGADSSHLDQYVFRTSGGIPGAPVLTTDTIGPLNVPGSDNALRAQFIITSDGALPMTILGYVAGLDVSSASMGSDRG